MKKTISLTEFRKRSSSLFSEVEEGEIFVVLRHGKPIAEISPLSKSNVLPLWKKPGLRLSVKGMELSLAILEERES
jgi:antitoxin (DNA-binding transcriptional repressor) of toxin-antitoxin stability system